MLRVASVRDKLIERLARTPPGDTPTDAHPSGSDASGRDDSRDRFVEAVLTEMFALAQQRTTDNYDVFRYSYDTVDRSEEPYLEQRAIGLRLFVQQADDVRAARALLADEESESLFDRLLLYKLLGHLHVRIRAGQGWESEQRALHEAEGFRTSGSSLGVTGAFGPIEHFEGVPTDDGPVKLDCWSANVVLSALKRQYYFDRQAVRIQPSRGDVVIDAGGCFGDTAVMFARSAGAEGHVYSFDPLPQHGRVIRHNIEQNYLQGRVTYVPFALGATGNGVAPSSDAETASTMADPGFSLTRTDETFAITSIDEFCEAHSVRRVDFVKMDIEGFEIPALEGARRTIGGSRPALAISAYHRHEDLWEIPLWIHARFPEYRFYLDHFTIHDEETVLYAVPAG